MVYTWSFAAGKPSFRCKLSDNDTVFDSYTPGLLNQSRPDEAYCKANMKISVKECQQCYVKTISSMGTTEVEPCKEFVFDRKYYQYTLVEEVCFVFARELFIDSVSSGQWCVIEQYFVPVSKIYFLLVTWLDRSFLESLLTSKRIRRRPASLHRHLLKV